MNSLQHMTITVPFIYEALVVKPRCRKPTLVVIRDKVDVKIKVASIDQLPVAFKVGASERRYYEGQLWAQSIERACHEKDRVVSVDEVLLNTENGGLSYKWSRSGSAAPFKNFWFELAYVSQSLGEKCDAKIDCFNSWLTDLAVVDKENVVRRLWLEDNRQLVVDKLHQIADGLVFVDGIVFTHASEPRYVVQSFGAGSNHSVAMFISYYYSQGVSNKCYFNAHEFEKAKAMCFDMGLRKTDALTTNCGNLIEVLIDEAVKCNPLLDHIA